MFEASIDGEFYDPERWAQYYAPYGLATWAHMKTFMSDVSLEHTNEHRWSNSLPYLPWT
jgi:hypothetical protein